MQSSDKLNQSDLQQKYVTIRLTDHMKYAHLFCKVSNQYGI